MNISKDFIVSYQKLIEQAKTEPAKAIMTAVLCGYNIACRRNDSSNKGTTKENQTK